MVRRRRNEERRRGLRAGGGEILRGEGRGIRIGEEE